MLDIKMLDEISSRINKLIAESPAGDVEKNLRAMLQSVFTKMELVSREEFDVQADVLRQAREKLDLLEAKLSQLENMLQKSNH